MEQIKTEEALSKLASAVPSSDGTDVAPQQQPNASPPDAAPNTNNPTPTTAASVDSDASKPMNTVMALPQDLPKAPGAPDARGGNQHHPVAEFLYQLTKMLTDDNSEIIEWVDGRIKVHHPERLESDVLHKYFRHSKFASFQRQLNYFGFRKIAGKGKMSPCSYVNENATSDIRSLLLIKRKTNGSAARKAMAQRALSLQAGGLNPALGSGLPGLAGAPGLGSLAALNQLQMHKQLSSGFLNQENPLAQLLQQSQQQTSWNDLQQLGGLKPNMPSIEQLQAQLAAMSKQQHQAGATAALNAAALNLASAGGASLGLSQFGGGDNPATAALNANPATAAMNSASAAAAQTNNLFESATNLKALIGNDSTANNNAVNGKTSAPGAGSVPSNSLLNRLPSSNGMYNGMTSNASLGNLLASSNRLSSLLSLNSFLSREPSLADLAMMPNGAQLAALGAQQSAATQQDYANRLNQGTA